MQPQEIDAFMQEPISTRLTLTTTAHDPAPCDRLTGAFASPSSWSPAKQDYLLEQARLWERGFKLMVIGSFIASVTPPCRQTACAEMARAAIDMSSPQVDDILAAVDQPHAKARPASTDTDARRVLYTTQEFNRYHPVDFCLRELGERGPIAQQRSGRIEANISRSFEDMAPGMPVWWSHERAHTIQQQLIGKMPDDWRAADFFQNRYDSDHTFPRGHSLFFGLPEFPVTDFNFRQSWTSRFGEFLTWAIIETNAEAARLAIHAMIRKNAPTNYPSIYEANLCYALTSAEPLIRTVEGFLKHPPNCSLPAVVSQLVCLQQSLLPEAGATLLQDKTIRQVTECLEYAEKTLQWLRGAQSEICGREYDALQASFVRYYGISLETWRRYFPPEYAATLVYN